jgi:parvulin-like peptidyl-prolyl isomerase
LIFIGASTLPIAHIAPAVVAVFVEAIDAGKVTTADVVAAVGKAQFAQFRDLWVLRLEPEN